MTPLLRDHADVVVPDLRGFGDSDQHDEEPARAYSANAQGRSVLWLVGELELGRPALAGYDVGSRMARGCDARRARLAMRYPFHDSVPVAAADVELHHMSASEPP